MSVEKVARPGSKYGDVLALFAPSRDGVVMEVEDIPDQDGEIQVEVGECSCYGDSHRAYLGPEERKALVAWLTAIDGAPGYVHALVDAWVTGGPLDFRGAPVPADVQERISAELARRAGGE